MLQTSEMSLYFIMRSLEVVAVREGDAFTCGNIHVHKTITELQKKKSETELTASILETDLKHTRD